MKLSKNTVLIALVVFLALLAFADFFVEHHGFFGIDGTPGFAAWFGFGAAVIAILTAHGFGRVARRKEDRRDD